jgi:predicted MFS family arabinose efflux permease
MSADPGPRRRVSGRYRAVLSISRYRRFAIGEVASAIGDGIGLTAVPWIALGLAPPHLGAVAVGLSIAAYSLPGAVAAAPAARLFRAWSAVRLVLADTVVRFVGLSTVAALALSGRLTLAEFVLLLAISSLLHPWGQGGRAGLVPLVVHDDDLLVANSFLFTSVNAGLTIVGPAVGGLIVATIGGAEAIAIDAATFLALLAALASLRLPARQIAPVERSSAKLRAYLLRGELAYLLALTVGFYALYGPFEVALPLFVRSNLHAGPELFGFAWAAFGVGALIGGIAGGALLDLRHRAALVRFCVAVVAVWGLAVAVIALFPVAAVLLASITIGGFAYAPYPSVLTTAQQRLVEPAMLPSVATAFSAASGGMSVAGTGVGGPIVALVGAQATLFGSGAATVLLALVVAVPQLRRRARRAHPPAADIT